MPAADLSATPPRSSWKTEGVATDSSNLEDASMTPFADRSMPASTHGLPPSSNDETVGGATRTAWSAATIVLAAALLTSAGCSGATPPKAAVDAKVEEKKSEPAPTVSEAAVSAELGGPDFTG
ncbi:MAG: hypothetical protein ACRDD1_04935, partial [Planctomycetia bacterium]